MGSRIVSVNYDDPRWPALPISGYAEVHPLLMPEHIALRRQGSATVKMECIPLKKIMSTQEAIQDIYNRGLILPDRAEAESFFDQHPNIHVMAPVLGFFHMTVQVTGRSCVPYVYACGDRRGIGFRKLISKCYDFYSILAVHP